MSIVCILLLAALIGVLVHAMSGKIPLWVPVLIAIIADLLACVALR